MKFHQHSTNNMILRSPPGMADCDDLPVTLMGCEDGTTIIASFWRPTEEELEQLKCGASIVLYVWGRTHSPVALGVETST